MKNIYERFGYFLKYIHLIGSSPVTSDFTIKSLELDRGAIQMGYREMKELEFPGTIIEYICWLSWAYIFDIWAGRIMRFAGEDVPEGTTIKFLDDILVIHPVETVAAVRVLKTIRVGEPWIRISPNTARLLTSEGGMDLLKEWHLHLSVIKYHLVQIDGESQFSREYNTNELDKIGLNELTRYYLRIPSLKPASGIPLQRHTNQPLTKNQLIDASPQTPHTTTLSPSPKTPNTKASSDAVSKAERSEASSKGRRTTRPRKRT